MIQDCNHKSQITNHKSQITNHNDNHTDRSFRTRRVFFIFLALFGESLLKTSVINQKLQEIHGTRQLVLFFGKFKALGQTQSTSIKTNNTNTKTQTQMHKKPVPSVVETMDSLELEDVKVAGIPSLTTATSISLSPKWPSPSKSNSLKVW